MDSAKVCLSDCGAPGGQLLTVHFLIIFLKTGGGAMPQRKVSALACLLTVIKAGSLGQKCPASPLRTIYGAGRLSEMFVPSVSP